ncbi:MAG: glycyl-radical enzyme activating protein [Lachnospiraceae bacterium]|nr:glycyl-radical enzyme activating protein [Lachnospiraceae bacterium]
MIREELLKSNIDTLLLQEGCSANIERYAINDGSGVRTTVFLKGCHLRCRWCSNPETQKFYPEMNFFPDKCIACMNCVHNCPYGAIGKDLIADREKCKECYKKEDAFACTKKCYVNCRKVTGDKLTVKQIYDIVKRDVPFYEASGGGVTISGGEPLAQPEFTYALLRTLTERWINTAIETCGFAEKEGYENIVPYLDTIFMDIKQMDSAKHRAWTGQGNEKILENIKRVNDLVPVYGNNLFIRIPIIPGFNDQPDEVEATARFVAKECKNVKGMELLPYHKLGRGKYYSLGRKYELEELVSPASEKMYELNEILAGYDIPIFKF